MSSLSTSLKNSYQRWLFPYEEYLRIVKPGVQQQLEFEFGGPITPSPLHSPMRPTHLQQGTPSYPPRPPSPTVRASEALQASINHNGPAPEGSVPPTDPSRPTPSSGFTPVNCGFAAINASPSGFVAVNNQPRPMPKQEGENGVHPGQPGTGSPSVPVTNEPSQQPPGMNATPLTNGHASNGLKRTMSHEGVNGDSHGETGDENGDEDGGSGRRSKRVKKGTRSFQNFLRRGDSDYHVTVCPARFLGDLRLSRGVPEFLPESWRVIGSLVSG